MKTRLLKMFAVCALSLAASVAPACQFGRQGGGGTVARNDGARVEGGSIEGAAAADAQRGGTARAAGEFKTFKGEIGSLAVQMRLRRAGASLEGSYFYANRRTDIELRGQIDARGDFTLRESSGGGHTGTFKGRWADDEESARATLEGEWTKPDGTGALPFVLREYAVEFAGARSLVSKGVKEENKKLRYTIEAEYPQIEGASDEATAKFNRAAADLVLGKVNEFKKDVAAEVGPAAGTETGSDLHVGYEVAFADDELISVEFSVGSYYSGAAHPNSHTEVVNFDLKRGRRLELADLFKPSSDYLRAVSRRAVNSLKAQSRKAGPEPLLIDEQIEEGAGPEADNFKSWTMTRKGLSITFDAYQVGPYAAGPQSVFIPYGELKDIIRADGPAARFVQ